MLRAKFKVESISREGTSRRLRLIASNQTDGDNKDWSKWTPSGNLELYISNEAVFSRIDAMNPGDHFWLDLSPIGG